MAKRTVTTLVDDIDGSEGTQSVAFGIDGDLYEIDLNEAHAEDLREVLAPYVEAARPVSGQRGHRPAARPAKQQRTAELDPKAVRAWAEQNGVPVSPRGRIKADVLDRYRAAAP